MPLVTAIKPQKNKKRVNIYLDDKFGFGLDLETFVKSGIKVEQVLTESEIEKIVREGEFQKTYNYILRFAMLRPRSEKELRDWLKRKKVHDSLWEELFKKLRRLELLDDEKFARWWIKSRITFKNKGPQAIAAELMQKGVDRNIIKNLLDELVSDETQLEIAKKHLLKKKYILDRYQGFERNKKVSEILLSRGFGWDIIKKITNIDD